jgi:hypothetical protein
MMMRRRRATEQRVTGGGQGAAVCIAQLQDFGSKSSGGLKIKKKGALSSVANREQSL